MPLGSLINNLTESTSYLPKLLLTSNENCITLSERTSLGYQSNSAPSASSAPSLCSRTKLLAIALASISRVLNLSSPSISFHATSASQLDEPPHGLPPPLSHPDMSASIISSKRSSLSIVNVSSLPISISKVS